MILVGPCGDVLGFDEISLGSSFVAVAVPAGPCSVPAQQHITPTGQSPGKALAL